MLEDKGKWTSSPYRRSSPSSLRQSSNSRLQRYLTCSPRRFVCTASTMERAIDIAYINYSMRCAASQYVRIKVGAIQTQYDSTTVQHHAHHASRMRRSTTLPRHARAIVIVRFNMPRVLTIHRLQGGNSGRPVARISRDRGERRKGRDQTNPHCSGCQRMNPDTSVLAMSRGTYVNRTDKAQRETIERR